MTISVGTHIESDRGTALVTRAQLAEKDGRWNDACADYERLVRTREAPLELRLSALRWIARARMEMGNRGAARDVLEAALASAEQAHNAGAIAQALNLMAILAQTEGDLGRAAALYVTARHRASSAGDRAVVAMIDQNAGTVANIRGDTAGALDSFRLSLAGYNSLGMTDYEGQVLNNMGLAFLETGAHDAAEAAYDEALSKFSAHGDRAKMHDVEVNRIQLWIAMRRFDDAELQCDKLMREAGNTTPIWLGEVYRHVGVISRERSNYLKAGDFLAQSMTFAERSADYLLIADVAQQQAELFWAEERHHEMLISLNRARAIYSKLQASHRVAQVERRNENLEARFLDIARTWGDSIEGADHYTQGHCERVANVACDLAVQSGIGPRDMFWFRLGALLHDVGKVIVPAEVLNKAGQLTPDEWDLMKRHPLEGLRLVANIDFPGDVRAMIRNHHERWDGNGYPDRLVHDATPLPARILCIADVYDALTSSRPYRRALSHSEGVDIMLSSDGQFDPALLEIFTDWAAGVPNNVAA